MNLSLSIFPKTDVLFIFQFRNTPQCSVESNQVRIQFSTGYIEPTQVFLTLCLSCVILFLALKLNIRYK